MALPSPPPPPDPPYSSTTTTTTTNNNNSFLATTRPLFPPTPRPPAGPSLPHQASFYSANPHHPPHPANSRIPSNPNPNYPHLVPSPHPQDVGTTTVNTTAASIVYPVASSGRGFLSKQTSTTSLTNPMPNSSLYHPRPGLSYARPPFAYSHPDPSLGSGLGYVTVRPTHLQHPTVVGNGPSVVMPGVIRGVPVSAATSHSQHKISVSPTSVSDSNGHKDLRERSKDDAFVTIRDRKVRALYNSDLQALSSKVRISDNASIYALCRSWLRNGFPEESQLPYQDTVRSLPRPLPLSAQDISSSAKKEDDKEIKEDEESAEHLSPQELLQKYIKRAKRVRSRLRVERLRRIARYKTRLALLLPPVVDPHSRNDLAAGN